MVVIRQLQSDKGLAISDLITHLWGYIDKLDLPSKSRIMAVERLAEAE